MGYKVATLQNQFEQVSNDVIATFVFKPLAYDLGSFEDFYKEYFHVNEKQYDEIEADSSKSQMMAINIYEEQQCTA